MISKQVHDPKMTPPSQGPAVATHTRTHGRGGVAGPMDMDAIKAARFIQETWRNNRKSTPTESPSLQHSPSLQQSPSMRTSSHNEKPRVASSGSKLSVESAHVRPSTRVPRHK